jgi:hypothetical protein
MEEQMKIFSNNNFEDAMKAFLAYADTLLPFAVQSNLNRQQREHNEKIQQAASAADTSLGVAMEAVGAFVPDKDEAERFAKASISINIGHRIRGAVACHNAGNEAECARLLVMAQAEVFYIIDMPKGSHALQDAADFMFGEQKRRKAA